MLELDSKMQTMLTMTMGQVGRSKMGLTSLTTISGSASEVGRVGIETSERDRVVLRPPTAMKTVELASRVYMPSKR